MADVPNTMRGNRQRFNTISTALEVCCVDLAARVPWRPEEEMEVVREAAAVALEGTGAWEAGSEVGWTVAEEGD